MRPLSMPLGLAALCLAALTLVAPAAVGAQAARALPPDSSLKPLETMAALRGLEAVGRLEIGGRGFCTATLIAEEVVLTAAHCLFDPATGAAVPISGLVFRAGLRNGRAVAEREVRAVAIHVAYAFDDSDRLRRVASDVALLALDRPVRGPVRPLPTLRPPGAGAAVQVVSYAHDRAEAPALQARCHVLPARGAHLTTSCDVDFGSSGAPILIEQGGQLFVASVVSAKAMLGERRVALGAGLDTVVPVLLAELARGRPRTLAAPSAALRAPEGTPPAPASARPGESISGARFLRPDGGGARSPATP